MSQHPTWLEPFCPAFCDAIVPLLTSSGRRVACFDADGTLWSEDIGEAFFRWLIAGRLLRTIDCDTDVYAAYEARVHEDRTMGYAWAVSLMAGLADADVTRWARQMAAAWPNYRPAMAALMKGLEEAGFEVWIVSASNRWIVRATMERMGLDPDRVVAIEVAVEDGILTSNVLRPITCRQGKVEAIDHHIQCRPVFAIGDSMGDLEMLECAQQPLIVGRHDQPQAEILAVAATRNWPIHRF